MSFKKIPAYIKLRIEQFNRDHIINRKLRKKLRNKDFSIIASTCNGGVLTSDLGVRFNSPFVNLWIYPGDFIKMLENLNSYLNHDLLESKNEPYSYPVGVLDDIKLYFMHYGSFDEAKEKWDRRKKRINYNNLFIMFTDRDGCTEEQLKRFDSLPYKNKVVFTAKQHKDIKSAVWCEEFSQESEVPVLTLYRNISGERLYDRYFDFVGWLNG